MDRVLKSEQGLSLVETVIAMSLLGVIGLGMASLIQSAFSSKARAENKQAYQSRISDLQMALQKAASGNPTACAAFIKVASPSFSATGETLLRIDLQPTAYQSGTIIQEGGATFRIDKVFLDNITALGSAAGGTYHSANIQVDASLRSFGNWSSLPRKTIANTTFKVDGSGQIIECNVLAIERSEDTCKALGGMLWDQVHQTCVQDVERPSGGSTFACSPGSVQAAGVGCRPSASACSYNQLPQSFSNGIVDACVDVPTTLIVQYPATYRPPNSPAVIATIAVINPAQSGNGATGVAAAPSKPAPSVCTCGSWTIPVVSTSQYCGTSQRLKKFLDVDLLITVYRCGTDGNLIFSHTYEEEERDCDWSGTKPISCASGGYACRVRSDVSPW